MVSKANSLNAEFKPHFKTHQSVIIGRWFRDEGITGITVSTPQMAEYFVDDGWNDITIAFPFFRGQIDSVTKLSKKCSLRLFVHDPEDIDFIDYSASESISIMIEVDAGYHRSGLSIKDLPLIERILNKIAGTPNLKFAGFYIHDGDTYKVKDADEVSSVVSRDLNAFKELEKIYPDAVYCLGDTPSCSLISDLKPATELSPGNLIFYDLMQVQIGSCILNDIGMLVKVPVAQQKPGTNECIIHGGAVHFSKEKISMNGRETFGQPVILQEDGKIEFISGTTLSALSQGHGTVQGLKELKAAYETDDLREIWVCPVHSCLTANLYDHYQTPDGKIIKKRILS